jgi:hypothetical protein
MKYKQVNDVIAPTTAPEGHIIVAIGPYVWGSGQTLEAALKEMYAQNAKRKCNYSIHICPISKDESPVDGMGYYSQCQRKLNCTHCK